MFRLTFPFAYPKELHLPSFKAAETPDVGLCCTTSPIWKLPELDIPSFMTEVAVVNII